MKTLNSHCTNQVKVKFLMKTWKKEDQYTIILPFADRPEVPYEVNFFKSSFPTKCVMIFLRFVNTKRFGSGMSQKCFWSIWDYSGPIPAYFGQILDLNRPVNKSYKTYIKNKNHALNQIGLRWLHMLGHVWSFLTNPSIGPKIGQQKYRGFLWFFL